MSTRFTRTDKEKWIAGSYQSARRRSPVRIPQCDTSALIEENKLTLIGRVTNPSVQKPKAVVAYMPQLWNLDDRVVGRDLGSECFQFRFENESDLQAVLKRGPYHFKNWMLILQQWEPIISDTFPAFITFWVKIHGIPLHFWSDQTIRTIGKELGAFSARDVSEGRIRVPVNGLGALEMSMPIRLPDGAVKTVELEYERLEKHCFNCFQLSHEKKDCPQPIATRPLGINQLKATQRMESERRRHEERRDDRQLPKPTSDGNRGFRDSRVRDLETHVPAGRTSSREVRYPSRPRESRIYHSPVRQRSRSPRSRHYSSARDQYISGHSRELQKDFDPNPSVRNAPTLSRGRETSRANSRFSPSRRSSPHRSPRRLSTSAAAPRSERSRYSRTPPPCPPRQPSVVPVVVEVGEGSSNPQSRRPALERISPRILTPIPSRSASRSNSGRLQEVEVQYAADNSQDLLGDGQSVPVASGSRRLHTSLRLGPVPAIPQSRAKGLPRKAKAKAATANPAATRKTTKASPKRRVVRSPLQGVSLRKRVNTKASASSRKKLCVDPQVSGPSLPASQDPMEQGQASNPPINLIPAINKGTGDFRSPLNPLP